jgi:hypothetical protein
LNGLWKADETFEKDIQTLVHEIYQVIQFEDCDAENVLNVFGGTGQQFNNREIQPNASVQQGSITNNNYYGVKPD